MKFDFKYVVWLCYIMTTVLKNILFLTTIVELLCLQRNDSITINFEEYTNHNAEIHLEQTSGYEVYTRSEEGNSNRRFEMKLLKPHSYYQPYWAETDEGNSSKTRSTPTNQSDCKLICPPIYKDNYKQICGQRFNTYRGNWSYDYKNFNNLCELEMENCKDQEKMWYLLHRGKCPDFTFQMFPTKAEGILDRKNKWAQKMDKLLQRKKKPRNEFIQREPAVKKV